MRLHLGEQLDRPIAQIHPTTVRAWYAGQVHAGKSRTGVAQSYRFIRSVLNVVDDTIRKNPCVIPGHHPAVPRGRRAGGLVRAPARRGMRVARHRHQPHGGHRPANKNWVELVQSPVRFEKDPKTEAGKRIVNVPPHVLPLLEEHMRTFAGTEFFTVGLDGRRSIGDTVYQVFARVRDQVGIQLTFHDLRHTGQTMAAAAGATLADLLRRLGHSSSVATLRYLHAVEGRDKETAQNLSRLAKSQSLSRTTTARRREKCGRSAATPSSASGVGRRTSPSRRGGGRSSGR